MGDGTIGLPASADPFWRKYDQPALDAIAEAVQQGWAEVAKPVSSVTESLKRSGYVTISPRPGEPDISLLTPRMPETAAARSLSAKYGTGVFPLHTDGAHMEIVPDLVLLEATAVDVDIPTLVCKVALPDARKALGDALTHGMFLIENGPQSFYAPAYRGGLRYDPGCMKPADDRAERVADYFGRLELMADAYHWERPGKTLIVANRIALHGRGDATAAGQRELKRVMLRKVQK